ncbi:dynamin [Nosema bombycis CQ1]|uniref:Dynamin n=1 Tax=Nosema bombycis (strain CQ1 / CVCC 102059) TaxID=578461 RepID=R0KRW9_NOSB1|nr:dynamin [Nosema bombycis CQ1]|eukprot:EOB13506.1 dynamin [Nosema bombycis CQ1]
MKGTDCVDLLKNKHSPLRLGYVGIVNRSFQDVQSDLPLEESREKEKAFFSKSPYNQFSDKIGSSYLMKRIHFLFTEEVKKCIPTLRSALNKLIEEKKAEINDISMTNLLIDYYHCLQKVIGSHKYHGVFSYEEENVLFEFKTAFDRFTCEYDFTDVEREIKSSDSLIFHEQIIKDIVRKNVNLIQNEIIERIDSFSEHLYQSISKITTSLSTLASSLNALTISKMESQYDLLITDIKKYILIQGLYVNTRYPNFEISKILNKIKISEEDCNSNIIYIKRLFFFSGFG